MRFEMASYAAAWKTRPAGGVPDAETELHVGVTVLPFESRPFALFRIQTSFRVGVQPVLHPPKMIISFVTESYTAECPARTGGFADGLFGIALIHCGVPPVPFASVRIHTSL